MHSNRNVRPHLHIIQNHQRSINARHGGVGCKREGTVDFFISKGHKIIRFTILQRLPAAESIRLHVTTQGIVNNHKMTFNVAV